MRVEIDTVHNVIFVHDDDGQRELGLHTEEGFSVLSRLWVTTGWGQRYTYGFSWLGRPVIQLPEDLISIQEAIYRVRPDVIVETGVAHGGSLIFYASILEAIGKGRVVGVDIEIRPHNRSAIESHRMASRISLVEGSSVDAETLQAVVDLVDDAETVLVVLDSNHSKSHVTAELDLYSKLVTPDSYIVATDGVMEWLEGVPGAKEGWKTDNPKAAVEEWLPRHPEFELEDPLRFTFNESTLNSRVTHWPKAFLRRRQVVQELT